MGPAHDTVVGVAGWGVNVEKPICSAGPSSTGPAVEMQFYIGAVRISEKRLVFLGKLVIEPQG